MCGFWFFFKQKTAYEMPISDWSSDVCSSDLAKKLPVMYRIHEPPSREKLVSLKDYLETFEQSFALGQVITPAVFHRLIDGFSEDDRLPEIKTGRASCRERVCQYV